MADHKKTRIVLFTYGGGMRGLVPAHIMNRIEQETGLAMSEMVDVFSGPSTGAILNAALNVPHPHDPGRPKYRARHLIRFYEREGIKIFPPDRFRAFRGFIHDFNNRTMKIGQLNSLFKHGHYSPAYLDTALKRLYGKHQLSDTLKSLVIPVYNIDGDQLKALSESGEDVEAPVHTKNNFLDEGGHAVWFKNIKLKKNYKAPMQVRLADAVLASCAAPTFFPCHHFQATYPGGKVSHAYSGIDGSIFDNPCITWHGAVRQHIENEENVIMLTLGTGYTLRSIKKEDWNRYGGLGVVDPANDLPLISILFHAAESALFESFSQEMGRNLYVFNKSMVNSTDDLNIPNTQIDDASPANLKRMAHFADAIIEENKSKFDEICHILVQNRDQAVKDKESNWTKLRRRFFFFKQIAKT